MTSARVGARKNIGIEFHICTSAEISDIKLTVKRLAQFQARWENGNGLIFTAFVSLREKICLNQDAS